MSNSMLTLISDALGPATNGRALAPMSSNTQKELAAVTERIDSKMQQIREISHGLEELYKLTNWKWLESEALHQVIVQLAPDNLTPEDMALLSHFKRQYQLSLLALSEEAQGALLRLVMRGER